MAKQNVSVQFNEQRSEKAGGKRFIKLDFIYRNNHHNRYMHWANCYNSEFVFLHDCLLHTIHLIFPGHLWTILSGKVAEYSFLASVVFYSVNATTRCLELMMSIHLRL